MRLDGSKMGCLRVTWIYESALLGGATLGHGSRWVWPLTSFGWSQIQSRELKSPRCCLNCPRSLRRMCLASLHVLCVRGVAFAL